MAIKDVRKATKDEATRNEEAKQPYGLPVRVVYQNGCCTKVQLLLLQGIMSYKVAVQRRLEWPKTSLLRVRMALLATIFSSLTT